MPWEVTIRRADGSSLGDVDSVRQQITTALPGMQFYREPSGPERIAAARAQGVEFPEVLRQHFESQPATERAEFEGDGFSVCLYGFGAQPLQAFHAEIRGEGNPVPMLAAMCHPHGWVAVDDASGQAVDLTGASAASWEEFRTYRDLAVRNIQASDSED